MIIAGVIRAFAIVLMMGIGAFYLPFAPWPWWLVARAAWSPSSRRLRSSRSSLFISLTKFLQTSG